MHTPLCIMFICILVYLYMNIFISDILGVYWSFIAPLQHLEPHKSCLKLRGAAGYCDRISVHQLTMNDSYVSILECNMWVKYCFNFMFRRDLTLQYETKTIYYTLISLIYFIIQYKNVFTI